MILRREIDELSTTVKVLTDKTTPELLRELQEKFADEPGLIDAKKLQKICISFLFCENNSFRLKLLLIIRLYTSQLLSSYRNFFSLKTYGGVQNRIVRLNPYI